MKKSILYLYLLITTFHSGYTQYTWKNVAIGAGGFVSAIITSKTQANVMYARTDVGGAYRWNAVTSEWIPLNDWASENETGYLGIESLALDPQDNSKVYMLAGISYFNGGKTAILRSSDYGNTFSVVDVSSQFKAHGNGMGRQTGEKLVVDPNNSNTLYCGTRWNGLFRSTDGGLTWTNLSSLGVTNTPNENGLSFVIIDPASGTPGNNSQKIFVGVSRSGSTNLYVSTNGGTNFSTVAGAPTTYMPHRAVLASDGNLFITYGNGTGPHGHWAVPEPMDNGEIWKYHTGTGTWTNVTPAGFTKAFGGITVDPNNPNRLLASSINAYYRQYTGPEGDVWGDRIFLSTNGGSSWTDLVGAAGIVLDANGSSWIDGHSIHWAGCIEFNPFNTNQAWITSGNGVFSCENVNATQTTWKFNVKGLEETVPLDIISISGGSLFSTIGDYDGFKHTDVTQYPPIHTPRMGTTTGIAYAAGNTDKLVRVGNNMYYTTDQGTTWTQCTMNGSKGKVTLSANGNILLHCPENSYTTYRSDNNGASWTTCNGLAFQNVYPTADPVNSSKFYAYNPLSGEMIRSTDGGINFSNAGSPGSWGSKIIRAVPGREGHLWVAMYNGGLKRSINSGTSYINLTNVTYCGAVGIGKAAPSASYETIYIWGTVGGVLGVHRSIDEGASWTRVNDDEHEFGGPGNGQFVIGDMNVYGRVYMSTAGRGIVYAETGSPLPVEWISFSVKKENESVKLRWQTASENKNDHFVIEKSIDGIHFYELGKISAIGNSNSLSSYYYMDAQPQQGIQYYRIKQVDVNEVFTYSEVKTLQNDLPISLHVFPIPSMQHIQIIGNQNHQLEDLKIYDLTGKLVLEYPDSTTNSIIDIALLEPGFYLIQCRIKNKTFILKFIKE